MTKEYYISEVDTRYSEPFNTIVRMDKRCFPNDDRYEPYHGIWWIAYVKNTPAAYAGLLEEGGGVAYLCRAGVLPAHRGYGLQKMLIRTRIEKAKNIGLTRLITSTYANPHSVNNLIDHGFRAYESVKPWGQDGTMYWALDL